MNFEVEIEGQTLTVADGKVGGHQTKVWREHPRITRVRLNGKTLTVYDLGTDGNKRRLRVNGKTLEVKVKTPGMRALEIIGKTTASGGKTKDLRAPMPGLVKAVFVETGQSIEAGAPILTLEAMKMENMLKAPAAVRIKAVRVASGAAVEKNAVLVEFD